MKRSMNPFIGRFGHEVSGQNYVTHQEANRRFKDCFEDAVKDTVRNSVGNPFVHIGLATGFVLGLAAAPYRQVVCDYLSGLF